jgi:hypothetical protein
MAIRYALAASSLCLSVLATAQLPQEDVLDIPTVKISPVIRITPLDEVPLSDKILKLLQAMVRQPVVLSDAQVNESARIIAGSDKRVMFGAGDRVYAVGADYPGQALPVRGQRLRCAHGMPQLSNDCVLRGLAARAGGAAAGAARKAPIQPPLHHRSRQPPAALSASGASNSTPGILVTTSRSD